MFKKICTTLLVLLMLPIMPFGVVAEGDVIVTNNILTKRYPLVNQTVICGFNEVGNVEGFTIGENVSGLEVKTSIANGPTTVYSGAGCLQISCQSAAANLWKTVYKNFEGGIDLSGAPLLSLGFNSYGGGPSADYYLKVNLTNGTQSFESISKVSPDKWNAILFDMSECSFLNYVTKIEISFMNNSSSVWGATYQIDEIKTGAPVDFSYTMSGSANLFTAESGTVSQTEGKLEYNFTSGDKLTSPLFLNSKQTIANAVLGIRNTMFFVMENKSSSDSIKVSFITESDQTYTDGKSKVFAIEPNSPKKAYYFNFSDNPLATGRLCGFRIEPNGAGSIEIDRITFEEEAKIESFAGEILSCTAQNNLVSISGSVSPEYLNQYSKIAIYELAMSNITDNIAGLKKLYEGNISAGFNVTDIPLMNANVSKLSSQFLAVVKNSDSDFKKIAPRFYIENWRDFENNPYEFTLPSLTVNVMDYGAKGDGFTDDTDSIQAAIDYVSSNGGGQVVLSGDNTFYGKRYVATNILMKSNVDLHIEKGAIIWQSQEEADYKYTPAYGHDGSAPGVTWAHNLNFNLPLIQGKAVQNIKITGNGKIRSLDIGSEEIRMGNYAVNCPDRIHVIAIGMWNVENIEISDVETVRANNYHTTFNSCRNIFVGNYKMHEVKCVSGDGLGLGRGTHNVKVVRSFLESNDDGIVLSSAYPTSDYAAWYWAIPGNDNSTRNIVVCHSYINSGGGKAIAFLPWGTNNPDLEKQEIYNIEVYDNVLNGGYSVGPWPDNPNNGKQPFDNTETDDYSPVKNVRIHDNLYLSKTSLECIQATNVITDCGIYSSQAFQNGDFALGHTNWTMEGDAGEQDGYGFTNGGRIYEGLYLKKGTHTFTASVNGTGRMFIEDAVTGVAAKEEDFDVTIWTDKVFVCEVTKSGTYYLGVDGTNAMIDTAVLTSVVTADNDISNAEFTSDFEDSSTEYWNSSGSWYIFNEDGNSAYRRSSYTGLSSMTTKYDNYENFEVNVAMKPNQWSSTVDNNFGFTLKASGSDNYFLEYSELAKILRIRRNKNGVTTVIYSKTGYQLGTGVWHNFKIRFLDGHLTVAINGTTEISIDDKEIVSGAFKINSYNVDVSVDNFSIKFIENTFEALDLDFDDGITTGLIPSTWTVRNGALTAPDANENSFVESTALYDDFDMSFDLQSRIVTPGADGNMGIKVRKNAIGSYFLEYNVIGNYYQIRKLITGGTPIVLGVVNNKIVAPSQWTKNIVKVKGRNIKWYVDGKLLLDVTDNGTSYYESGTFTVQAYRCAPALDNLKTAQLIEVPIIKSFYNNFEDSDTSNFILSGGYALAVDGTNVLKTTAGGTVSTVYTKYQDFIFDAEFKFNSAPSGGDGNWGILYRRNDNLNTFYFIEYNPQNKFFQVRRVVNSNWVTAVTVKRVAMDLSISKWHKIKVTSNNQNISVFIDEVEKVSFANDLVDEGRIAITTYNNNVSVDNIRMQAYEYTNKLTISGTFNNDKINITAQSSYHEMNALLIIASYDSNKKLVGISQTNQTIHYGENTMIVDAPATLGVTTKIMLWSDLLSMTPFGIGVVQ